MRVNIIFLGVLTVCHGKDQDNYQQDNNKMNDKKPKFRSFNANQLWEKAEKINLPDVQMSDLYVELKHYDRLKMDLKRQQVNGGESNGLAEADLERKQNIILAKYRLSGKEYFSNSSPIDEYRRRQKFTDGKLNTLWERTVENHAFSDAELNKLYMEFKHHEEKLQQMYALAGDMAHVGGGVTEWSENDADTRRVIDEARRTNEFVSDLHYDVMDGYKRLHMLTKKMINEDVDETEFIEPRVMELWQLAQKSNFTEPELASIKSELTHFQNRIGKHRHYREKLQHSAEKMQFYNGKREATGDRAEQHRQLLDRVRDLGNKMQKSFEEMRKRLSAGVLKHSEL